VADIGDGISQRKGMAMAKGTIDSGSFGVAPFASVNGGKQMGGGHPTENTKHGVQSNTLGDAERGCGKHVGRGSGMMGAQRAPDHGPHNHGDFGVTKLSST
jgi:hypothetical protein